VLFRNRGVATLRGLELEAHALLPGGFGLTGSAETSRGRDGVDGTPLDDVAASAVSVTLRHALGSHLFSYVRVKGVGSHDAAGPSEVPTSAYTMADAGLAWRLSRHLELRGSLRNILEEAYQSSAGPRWVWAPGRHGSMTLVVSY
jgi:outer membrane receptor protein involved in Fe transport